MSAIRAISRRITTMVSTTMLALPAMLSAQGALADYQRAETVVQRLTPMMINLPGAVSV